MIMNAGFACVCLCVHIEGEHLVKELVEDTQHQDGDQC